MRKYAIFLWMSSVATLAPVDAQSVVMKILNFPDNQFYSEAVNGGSPSTNTAIVNYGVTWGANAYIGVGDNFNNTGNSTDLTNIPTWVSAINGTGIKWITPPGNHDYDDIQNGSGNVTNARTSAVWQSYIGNTMASQASIVGNYPTGSNVNSVLDIGTYGGIHWAAIVLEYCPRSATLTWANGIITSNPTWKFIIATHDYLTNNATLDDVGNGSYSCSQEGYTSDYNYGQGIWDGLVKLHDDQIRLVLNGHWNPTSNFSARRRDAGTHGYYVDQVYFDPQQTTNGGNGYIRLLSFMSDGTIGVQTYSPTLSSYLTDSQNQFTLAAQNPPVTISAYGLNVRGKRRSLLAGGTGGFANHYSVTIDHTKVGTADSSNWTLLFAGGTQFKTTANSGCATNSNGYDIVPYTDSALTSQITNFQLLNYSATAGTMEMWIQIPTLSHTTDTTIYLGCGKGSITTFQGTATAAWDSSHKLVVHLPDGTTLTQNDSTSNAFTGTIAAGTISATTGQIDGGAIDSVGSSGTRINFSTGLNSFIYGASQLTAELWLKTTNTYASQGSSQTALINHNSSTNGAFFLTPGGSTATNNQADFTVINSTPTRVNLIANLGTTYNDGNWHYLVGTYDGSTMTLYFDGASKGTASQTGVINSPSSLQTSIFCSSACAGSGSPPFVGSIDEVRISNTARSSSWVLANYNNQSSPSTFYTVVSY